VDGEQSVLLAANRCPAHSEERHHTRARAERFRVPGELVIHVPLETPYLVWRGYRVDRIVLFINHVRPYAVKEGWRLAVRAAKPNHIVALFSGSGGQRQLKSIGQN